jgi:hypothetical protein
MSFWSGLWLGSFQPAHQATLSSDNKEITREHLMCALTLSPDDPQIYGASLSGGLLFLVLYGSIYFNYIIITIIILIYLLVL